MPASLSIPNTVYALGDLSYGPLALADGDSEILVTLDRTVASGLNTKAPATKVTAVFELLLPGDPVWHEQGRGTFEGGIRTDPELGQLNTDYLGVSLWQPGLAGRSARCRLNVAGTTVRLAGTVAVT